MSKKFTITTLKNHTNRNPLASSGSGIFRERNAIAHRAKPFRGTTRRAFKENLLSILIITLFKGKINDYLEKKKTMLIS